ncbi:MAG: iron ABC transporter permease [Chloroflexi bacterium]|nr:iron ABC transporter permease [Chloroflexota bacterium]
MARVAAAASPRPLPPVRRRRYLLAMGGATAAALALVAANLALGAVAIAPASVIDALVRGGDGFAARVVWDIRLPRVLDAMAVGAALATAGALLQVITRNPLADPTILGVSAAAGLASATALVLWPLAGPGALTAAAVAGGLVGAGVIFVIAWQGIVSPLRLTLAGVAVAAFFGAAIVALLASSRTFLQLSLGFLVGGLYGSTWAQLGAALPWLVPAFALALLAANRLNVLALGDEVAAGLGVAPTPTRLLVLAATGALTGVAVAIAGLVSFVGLVSPHLARYAVGHDARRLLPASALTGALLVLAADLVARLVVRPAEIPMGIVTAAIGAPFLLFLLRVRR